MKLLNIGCGTTYHPDWVNIDVAPVSHEIMRHDAAEPLPFEDGGFDACYSSHLLEHLPGEEALRLLVEIRRVLKPGGIVRLAVPDLEAVVRAYLDVLERCLSSPETAEPAYDWLVLELLDQLVRDKSGGLVERFLRSSPVAERAFISARIGSDAERFWKSGQVKTPFAAALSMKHLVLLVDRVRLLLVCGFAWLLGGKRGVRAVREGWFRTSGEVHRWMYDRFSLGRLLLKAGFCDVSVCAPDVSRIPGFAAYGLDVADGVVRKPDSLFMEGVRT